MADITLNIKETSLDGVTPATITGLDATDLDANSVEASEIAAGAVGASELATDAVETLKIKDANVTLGKLAAGITSSHIVKFFKKGDTITTTALTGVAVGDLVVSILANGTATVGIVATINTLPADPADDTYVIVFRAAA